MNTIKIIQLTPEELQNAISETLQSQLQEFSKNFAPKDPDELLTRKETAAIFKINLATLWSWTKQGKIKAHGTGSRVYYMMSDIKRALIEIN